VTMRNGHGTGAGQPRIEVLPVDELPRGVQAPPRPAASGERRPDGRYLPGAYTDQSAGGTAKKHQTRLARALGLSRLDEGADFAPYRRSAKMFARRQCSHLAQTVGGGAWSTRPRCSWRHRAT
jgi:hypothetical protein